MKSANLFTLLLFILFFSTAHAQSDSLSNYITRLKNSQKTGGSETSFMSIGSDFMYGQEYFEAGNYSSAAWYFEGIVKKDKDHPYANYQLAISLLKQKDSAKAQKAKEHLKVAFTQIPGLQDRFNKEMPGINNTQPSNNTDDPIINDNKNINISNADGLDKYIAKIKYSRSAGGSDTYMNSPGLDAYYGIEYYESGNYRSAETNFSLSLSKDSGNTYVNYLKSVSLAAQGKHTEAELYLKKAIAKDASLKERFIKDSKAAAAQFKKLENDSKVKTTPAVKVIYGGSLVYGNYTCHQSVWNGPGVSPAYRQEYKGYFQLRKDGTYKWLDDGVTGKFKYDSKTGAVIWVSGYFKSAAPKLSQYQKGTTVAQITITFSENNRWECGCKK